MTGKLAVMNLPTSSSLAVCAYTAKLPPDLSSLEVVDLATVLQPDNAPAEPLQPLLSAVIDWDELKSLIQSLTVPSSPPVTLSLLSPWVKLCRYSLTGSSQAAPQLSQVQIECARAKCRLQHPEHRSFQVHHSMLQQLHQESERELKVLVSMPSLTESKLNLRLVQLHRCTIVLLWLLRLYPLCQLVGQAPSQINQAAIGKALSLVDDCLQRSTSSNDRSLHALALHALQSVIRAIEAVAQSVSSLLHQSLQASLNDRSTRYFC